MVEQMAEALLFQHLATPSAQMSALREFWKKWMPRVAENAGPAGGASLEVHVQRESRRPMPSSVRENQGSSRFEESGSRIRIQESEDQGARKQGEQTRSI